MQTAYFARWGFACPPHYNPADFFLDFVSMDYRTPEAEFDSRQRIALLSQAYIAQNAKEIEVQQPTLSMQSCPWDLCWQLL